MMMIMVMMMIAGSTEMCRRVGHGCRLLPVQARGVRESPRSNVAEVGQKRKKLLENRCWSLPSNLDQVKASQDGRDHVQ